DPRRNDGCSAARKQVAADTGDRHFRTSWLQPAKRRHRDLPPRRADAEEAEMRLRSLLFVPGDSERKFAKARGVGADALILDLEDSVAPSQKAATRDMVSQLLEEKAPRDWAFFVRINAVDTGLALHDRHPGVESGPAARVIA